MPCVESGSLEPVPYAQLVPSSTDLKAEPTSSVIPSFPVSVPEAELVESNDPPICDAGEQAAIAGRVCETASKPGFIRRLSRGIAWLVSTVFCVASLIAVLAGLTVVPLLQFIAFGYLLDVAGRLASGNSIRDSVPNLDRMGQIGLAGIALFLVSLIPQLFVQLETSANLINPGSDSADWLRFFAIFSAFIAICYLLWAWIRGGRLWDYLWPQPVRFFKEAWRPDTWVTAPDRLWEFTTALEIPRLFSLGLRGAIATLVWLIPGMIIMAMTRNGETGAAGLLGGIALVALGGVMLYLPMLQANFAAENRFSAMFEVKRIRQDFAKAPWAWLLAMICGLVILPVPLYLLKIEATPDEVVMLPCLVFVAFILPARIAEGLALRRSRKKSEIPRGRWATFSRFACRLLMLVVVATYLFFVFISQFTNWYGLAATWVEQHAVLFPRPFLDGV